MFRHLSFAERVWRGDPRTIRVSRQAWKAHPQNDELFVAYVTTLYSFRALPWIRRELQCAGPRLCTLGTQLQLLLTGMTISGASTRMLDRTDTVTTHLAWLLEEQLLPETERERILSLIVDMCTKATPIAEKMSEARHVGWHTPLLIMLTHAQVILLRGGHWQTQEVLNILETVARNALFIERAEQKNRVYRKLGLLLRRAGERRTGYHFGWLAVRDTSTFMAVRLKSLFALLKR